MLSEGGTNVSTLLIQRESVTSKRGLRKVAAAVVVLWAVGCGGVVDHRTIFACRVDHVTGEYKNAQLCLATQKLANEEVRLREQRAEQVAEVIG